MNTFGGRGLWDEEDGFYYDQIREQDEEAQVLRGIRTCAMSVLISLFFCISVSLFCLSTFLFIFLPLTLTCSTNIVRSMVGLIPMFACLVLEDEVLEKLPSFKKRLMWFLKHTPHLAEQVKTRLYMTTKNLFNSFYLYIQVQITHDQKTHLLAIPSKEQLTNILGRMLDEKEFLAPFGLFYLSFYVIDRNRLIALQAFALSASTMKTLSQQRLMVWTLYSNLLILFISFSHSISIFFQGMTSVSSMCLQRARQKCLEETATGEVYV